MHTDHINGNKLDNRKSNLRVVTASQNHMNRRKDGRKGLTSTLKGAQYHKASGLWRSRIKVGDKHLSLGYFKTEMEAHTAYINAAKEHFGAYRFVG
jgi:metal-dependent hydrolase (beta-lactamase superfamily II)